MIKLQNYKIIDLYKFNKKQKQFSTNHQKFSYLKISKNPK
ncbi:hypothetical protein AS4_05830 [Acinetobacter guillouiae]|nr:hypothetical protein AS4_05830 [Acinetobacter guillouiae]